MGKRKKIGYPLSLNNQSILKSGGEVDLPSHHYLTFVSLGEKSITLRIKDFFNIN